MIHGIHGMMNVEGAIHFQMKLKISDGIQATYQFDGQIVNYMLFFTSLTSSANAIQGACGAKAANR
jgi:hypothetical protein